MIKSTAIEFGHVDVPSYIGEIQTLPFLLEDLATVPELFKEIVAKMIENLPIKKGQAFLTVDGKIVEQGKSHRRPGAHIDGNFIPGKTEWGGGAGGGGWKVGGDGRTLPPEVHKLSYETDKGGILIVSDYPACKGWNGIFTDLPGIGGDCSHIKSLGEGYMLKPNVVYCGSSQWIHESLPIDKTTHRTLVRINLDMNYPLYTDFLKHLN